MKEYYCLKNNIPLIRIPYTAVKDITIEMLKLDTSQYIVVDKK